MKLSNKNGSYPGEPDWGPKGPPTLNFKQMMCFYEGSNAWPCHFCIFWFFVFLSCFAMLGNFDLLDL